MAASKKKPTKHKIQASDVEVGKRTLEAVLTDLAEVVKECAVRSARAEEVAAEAAKRSELALQAIGTLLHDLRALAERTDGRLVALETAAE